MIPGLSVVPVIAGLSYIPDSAWIAQGTGTAIGDLTNQGGIASCFDGVSNQAFTSGGASLSSLNPSRAHIGKDWGSGNTKTLTGFRCWSPNNVVGFHGSGGDVDITLKGSNSAPTSWDGSGFGGTQLHQETGVSAPAGSNTKHEILTGVTSGSYRYHWIELYRNVSGEIYLAEAEFYGY